MDALVVAEVEAVLARTWRARRVVELTSPTGSIS